jgi:ATP-binding cassette subfamily B protein
VLIRRTVHPARSGNLAVVRQERSNDCGPAALATIAAQHKRPFDYAALREQATLGSRGTDLLALSQLAEKVGFHTRGVKGSYGAMSCCTFPAIAHLRRSLAGGHFVVVHEWTSAGVVIADPGKGLRKLSRRAFCRRWTGYLLLVEEEAAIVSASQRGNPRAAQALPVTVNGA